TANGTGSAHGSGNSTITSSALSAAAHTLTVKQTDIAGNTSAASASLVVTIDTAAAAPSAPDLQAAFDSGSSSTDNITNVTTPHFSGSGAEAGATVTLYDTNGTTELGTGTADASRNWTISSSALSSCAHTVTVQHLHSSPTRRSSDLSLVVTIDTAAAAPSAPDLQAAFDSGSSSTDNITNVTTPHFSGNGAEAGATVTLYD